MRRIFRFWAKVAGKPSGVAATSEAPIYAEINALRSRIDACRLEAARYQREARLRQLIAIALARYFIKNDRSAAVSIPYQDVVVDSNPDWIPGILARSTISEPEFAVFKYFGQDSGTILDIGANYGYAAASIWATGAKSRILSFEPNPWHVPCLQRIKEMRPGVFDYIRLGLGASAGETRFVIPVLEGIGISALGSATIEAECDWTIPENVLHHMLNDHPNLEAPCLQFTEVTWQTERLDDVLSTRRFDIDLSTISAIKIDVEGFEAEVLAGAPDTVRMHTPLIMVEGANRNAAVVSCLSAHGYCYADFRGDHLVRSDQDSMAANFRAPLLFKSLQIPF
jgi:FkbM family methyltransferase